MREISVLDGLSSNELQEVYQISRKRVYQKNEMIFEAQDVLRYLYVLINGQIGVQEDQEDGSRSLMAIISKPMDCFGEVYLLLEKPLPLSAMAMKESEVLLIEKKYIDQMPKLSANLNTILAHKAFRLTQKMRIMMKDSLREKLMTYLRQHRDVQLKRYELADYLGVSRPALSKEISKMQDENLIYMDENGKLWVK